MFYRQSPIIRVFVPNQTARCRIHIAQPRVNPVLVRSKVVAERIVDCNEISREFKVLVRRKYLWADDTIRLGELAASLGVQVQMERHYFNSGVVHPFTLP